MNNCDIGEGEDMAGFILYLIGSVVIIGWGVAHIIPTSKVIAGFGEISQDNRRILRMEWLSEGFTLCFLGALVFILAVLGYAKDMAGIVAIRCAAGMLVVMAVLTALTGSRTKSIPMKICPVVKTATALLWLIGSFI
jgi:hypothetical protein